MTPIDKRDLDYAISRAIDLGGDDLTTIATFQGGRMTSSTIVDPELGEPMSVEEQLLKLRRLMTPFRPDAGRDEIAVWNMSQFCAVLEAELGDRLVRDGINRATTFSGIPIVTDPSIPEGEIEFRTAAGEKRRVKIIEL